MEEQRDSRIREGQQLGNYYLIQQIGQGGFANVYLGIHTSLHIQAAIKVLHVDLTGEEAEKFLVQAHTISSLSHPHIVRIQEYGVENGHPFLAMDYVPNGTLRQLHAHGTQLPLSTIVSYVKQVADALQYVHDQNLIHRDIKPHNMLLGSNYKIMLSDFGIAIASPQMGLRRQQIQDFEGTILYAAPEQIRGRPRIASDQYSLAIVVYEWLSGDWPFHGTVEEIASQHTLVPPPPLHEKVPMISPIVEQVVLKALAKDPHERFESVQEFARTLERASRLDQSGRGVRQPTPPPLSPLPQLSRQTPLLGENDAPPHAALLTYQGHKEKIHTLAWSPDGTRIASSSPDETVQVWNPLTGQHLLTHRGNSLQPQAIAWSPDSRFIASTRGLSADSIHVWNASTGQVSTKHATYQGHSESVLALAWSPDGKLIASASEDKTVQVWDVTTGRTLFTYRGHSLSVIDVAWSPDSKRIASCSEDKTAHVWDATTGSNIHIFYAHRDKVNAVTWSPGGTLVASASNDISVQVWDSSTGRKVCTYAGHIGGTTDVSWSPDGIRIASSSLDETVRVWHVMTGNTLFTYTGHVDWVSTVAWSPDGKHIASGSWDKTVQVWQVK